MTQELKRQHGTQSNELSFCPDIQKCLIIIWQRINYLKINNNLFTGGNIWLLSTFDYILCYILWRIGINYTLQCILPGSKIKWNGDFWEGLVASSSSGNYWKVSCRYGLFAKTHRKIHKHIENFYSSFLFSLNMIHVFSRMLPILNCVNVNKARAMFIFGQFS